MKLDYKAYNAWALTWLIELPRQRPDLIVMQPRLSPASLPALLAAWTRR